MSEAGAAADSGVDLYLDLLKKTLTNVIYGDASYAQFTEVERQLDPPEAGLGNDVRDYDPAAREAGLDWPTEAHTMVGLRRLDNLHECLRSVLADGVPGDVIETGAWRGGVCIFMRAFLRAHGCTDRTVWVADSFEGLPPPAAHDIRAETSAGTADADLDEMEHGVRLLNRQVLGVSAETVRENFRRYGLLDEQVRMLPGWFDQTLPAAPIERLAVLRLDGDFYRSTIDALDSLYPRLSVGGYAIIDDYNIPGCRKAVDAYRAEHGIDEAMTPIDDTAVYWRRTA